jgi:cell wall-associated NlpC family hydrolase
MDPRRQLIINKAREYLGTPYKHQGRTKHGLDCIGLIRIPFADLGYETDDFNGYGENADIKTMAAKLEKHFVRIRGGQQLFPADVLWMRANDGLERHLALYTENQTIIHATNWGAKKVVEHRYSLEDRAKTFGLLRWKGFID